MRFYDTSYSGITSDCYQVCVYVTECGVWMYAHSAPVCDPQPPSR